MESSENSTTLIIQLRSTSDLACIYQGAIWWLKNHPRPISWVVFKKLTRVIPDANSRRPRCTKFASGMTRGNFSKSNRQTWAMKWISSIYIYFYQLKTVWQHCHLYLRISYLFDQPRMDYSAWSNTEAFDHIVEGSSRKAFWSIRPSHSSFCRS